MLSARAEAAAERGSSGVGPSPSPPPARAPRGVVISELTAVAEEGCAAASSSPSAREAEGVVSAAAPGSSAKTRGRRALLGGSSGAREPREEGREKGREGREESEERKTPRAAESGGAPRTRAGPLGSPGADPPASRPPLLDAAPTASARLAPENAPRTACPVCGVCVVARRAELLPRREALSLAAEEPSRACTRREALSSARREASSAATRSPRAAARTRACSLE
mmetsp:Transcript_18003/g.46118  ORF Transcript_18003/g.46118 Transcript_18003/m.46118 type:complete len:226 (-) Transcript_18003:1065-1742(-)